MATEEEIKGLAYTLWEEDGCPDGKDQEHYFTAEQMLAAADRAEDESSNFTNNAMIQDAARESSVVQEVNVAVS